MNSKAPSANHRLYEDFVPTAQWVIEECKTLEIHLPGFRKEQVRVQLENHGNLKLSGERPLEGNKWSRFCLSTRIPKDCKSNDIHAKFTKDTLQIVLPKKIVPTSVPDYHPPAQQDPTSQKIANDHTDNNRKETEEQIAAGVEAKKPEIHNTDIRNVHKSPTYETGLSSPASYEFGIGGYVIKLSKPRRMLMVNVGVAIIMLVAAGAYTVQRLRSSPSGKAGGYY